MLAWTPLKARYDELSLECEIYYHSRPQSARAEIEFLIKHLLREAKTPEQSAVAITKSTSQHNTDIP